jgi:hypothetical protein
MTANNSRNNIMSMTDDPKEYSEVYVQTHDPYVRTNPYVMSDDYGITVSNDYVQTNS